MTARVTTSVRRLLAESALVGYGICLYPIALTSEPVAAYSTAVSLRNNSLSFCAPLAGCIQSDLRRCLAPPGSSLKTFDPTYFFLIIAFGIEISLPC